jgi:hypothetical protein
VPAMGNVRVGVIPEASYAFWILSWFDWSLEQPAAAASTSSTDHRHPLNSRLMKLMLLSLPCVPAGILHLEFTESQKRWRANPPASANGFPAVDERSIVPPWDGP